MNRVKKILYSFIIGIGALVFNPQEVLAQGNELTVDQDVLLMSIVVLLSFIIIVLIVVIFSLQSMKRTLISEEAEIRGVEETDKTAEWWSRLMAKMTRSVPIEKEADLLLDHNYDGIRELDNHLPPWWSWLFRITVIFGVIYILVYHVFESAPLQTEAYQIEMAEAEAAIQARQAALVASGEAFDESTIEFSDDPGILASGESIFKRQCAACHREDGGGGIGPNLTDQYFLHGASISEIYNTIKVGVPDKGMISWEPVLSAEQMRDVSSYIITLVGTNPENPKAPQGDLIEGDI